ncbi:MAG: helix-turn-helix transcriptional regulator [Alphaproteobacteria bacterium]|nr:helix-turn-helix transcriptional regulator [Alphaproteobacteria bacterium]
MTNRIKEIRKEKGLTQAQLAEKIGVFQSVVQKVEAGTTDLNLHWMKKLSKALDVSPLELLPDEFITRDEVKILLLIRKGNIK